MAIHKPCFWVMGYKKNGGLSQLHPWIFAHYAFKNAVKPAGMSMKWEEFEADFKKSVSSRILT